MYFQITPANCPVFFDTILCWPKTTSGTWATLPCPDELKGIHYDISRKFTRI